MKVSLCIDNVTKMYGASAAVEQLQLTIPKSGIFGLLGANGAGKTTTIRMVLGLLSPSTGKITWNGDPITYETCERIGLSKGNQQKIQFIAAVLNKPELLFLDEPFSGLDPINAELLKRTVVELANDGTTIVFSSHRMEHVEELCESLCILHHGKPVVQGNLKEIKRSFGKKNIMIHTDVELDELLSNFTGVTKLTKTAQGYIVQVEEEGVSQTILQKIMSLGFFP
jgi:ABC-2 type transport system ATP-binding protein